jgi:hypothetical protein
MDGKCKFLASASRRHIKMCDSGLPVLFWLDAKNPETSKTRSKMANTGIFRKYTCGRKTLGRVTVETLAGKVDSENLG